MAVSAEEEFISNFHSLDGITVGEKQKNLFLLMNETRRFLETTYGEINFSSLKPKTPLEENLKVETLIYFRKIPELLHVLKNENPILIEKVLNVGPWFIQDAFRKISGEELVTHIFPHLSYNTKIKLINKLALRLKDPQKADEYFRAIKKAYGVYMASKLLPACSAHYIIECIQSNRIEITPRQLLTIIKKYPKLTEKVFEILNDYNSKAVIGEKYKFVFSYLARRDFPLFLVLNEKYNTKIRFGTRATNTFFSREKQSFIQNPKKFCDLLKTSEIGKNLKEDFKCVYFNLFPRSVNRLKDDLDGYLWLLKYLPSEEQKLEMLSTTFKAIYGYELMEHQAFALPKLIKMMSPDDREAWMETHSKPDEITEEEWISYMKTEKSIPLLKEKILLTSKMNQREKLVKCLVSTCKINDDQSALLHVCEYMLNKHRNDHFTVRQEYLKVLSSLFDLLKLGDDHWKYINEFVTLCRLHGEQFWAYNDISEKYIFYSLEKGLPVEELLKKWSELKDIRYNICKKKPRYEKQCLLMFNETLPVNYKEVFVTCKHVQYLQALVDWNEQHPKDKISLFINSNCTDCLKRSLATFHYAFTEERVAAACIRTEHEKFVETGLLKIYLSRQSHFSNNSKVVRWLIKNEPGIFLDHVELLTKNVISSNHTSYFNNALLKYYKHLEISEKISAVCLKAMNDPEEKLDKRKCAAVGLSYTMDPNEFLQLVASSYPFNLTIDYETKEGQNAFKLQQSILLSLKNINPPSLALDSVLRFCKGDYLNVAHTPLYSVSHNTAENKLGPVFSTLAERAVSVRKHAIFLAVEVWNKSDTWHILTKFMVNEKNASMRKSLFRGVFHFFVQNPSDRSWEFVKESVQALDANDKDGFNILSKCRRIPSSYFAPYVVFTWAVLEKFPNSNEVILEGKCSILEAITPKNIVKLPSDFCDGIIRKYFLKSMTSLSYFQTKINSFVCNYIIYCTSESERAERMKLILTVVKNYMQTTWNDMDTIVIGSQTVSDFVKEFCSHFMDKKCLNKQILNDFITLWDDHPKPDEAFDEFLYLRFTSIYLTCLNDKLTMPQIGEKLALLCDSIHDQGSLLTVIFSKSMGSFKKLFLSTDPEGDNYENESVIIQNIIKNGKTSSCLILALSLIPKNVLMTPKIDLKYRAIMEAIMKDSNSLVKKYLHYYLRNGDN